MASGRFVGRTLARIFGSCAMDRWALVWRNAPRGLRLSRLNVPGHTCRVGPRRANGAATSGVADGSSPPAQPAGARVSRYVLMSSLIYPAITWALAAATVAAAAMAEGELRSAPTPVFTAPEAAFLVRCHRDVLMSGATSITRSAADPA